MAAIVLPAEVGPFRRMQSTSQGAAQLAGDLRAVTTDVKEVQAWAQGSSSTDWAGEAQQSAVSARARFAVRLDGGEAALDGAVVAADRFEDRLRRLENERIALERERTDLGEDIETVRSAIAHAGESTDLTGLERIAARLRHRAGTLVADISAWETRYQAAEDDFVTALQAVDTVGEGRAAARAPGRLDPTDLLHQLSQRVGDPAALAAWWRTLTRAQRECLVTEAPHLLGNADGIPVTARDQANRAYLGGRLDYLGRRERDGQLTDAERAELEKDRRLADLVDRYSAPDPDTGGQQLFVIGFRPDDYSGDGGVVVSLGNPDTADHVATYVPGTTSEGGDLSGFDRIDTLHDTMVDEGRGSVATILWDDYDAPSADSFTDVHELADIGGVVSTDDARVGGERLADFVDGLRATDRGAPEDLTLIGHSYGATTAAYAAQDGAAADQYVLLGSPGAPAPTAGQLTHGDVYVGAADYDPVSLLGLGSRGGVGALGYDPAQESFGATRFDVAPGSYRVEDLLHNHTSYFGGRSLDNITDIATGGDPTVDAGRAAGGDGSYQNLSELLAGSTTSSGGEWLFDRGKDLADDIGHFGDSLLHLARPHP
ncbi:alpha/beta hydrolase [Nocardioides panacisoli]|uniref:DUF1023 domain-containing protein n=1 Tax=Nocardioides panacisoli TaxID=627624 RepID=A0ABP7HU33_9ACTN